MLDYVIKSNPLGKNFPSAEHHTVVYRTPNQLALLNFFNIPTFIIGINIQRVSSY